MSQLNVHHGHTTAEVSGLISVAWGSLARTENITLAPSCIVSTERGYYSQGSNRWIQFKHSTHTAVTQDLQGIGAENSTYTKYMHEKKKKFSTYEQVILLLTEKTAKLPITIINKFAAAAIFGALIPTRCGPPSPLIFLGVARQCTGSHGKANFLQLPWNGNSGLGMCVFCRLFERSELPHRFTVRLHIRCHTAWINDMTHRWPTTQWTC